MTDDLIERLHSCEYVAYYDGEPGIVADENLLHEAADRIETQANTIEELRSANERWAIAFNQAEERANARIEALQTDNAKLQADNAKLRTALLPFARHVGKVDALVILKIGADTWTGTLTGQDFANAYHEVNLANPKYREWLALQETER